VLQSVTNVKFARNVPSNSHDIELFSPSIGPARPHCRKLQHVATHCFTLYYTATLLQHYATLMQHSCNTPATLLQHSCNTRKVMQRTVTHCTTVHRTRTPHTATRCTEQQLFCVCEWRKKWLPLVAHTFLHHVCPIIFYFYLVHGHGIAGHHVYVTIQAKHTPAFQHGHFCGRVDGEDVAGSGVENQHLLKRRTRPEDEIDETILRENSPMIFCNGRRRNLDY